MNGSSTPPAPRKPRRRWRWHVPPALVHGPEALEGAEILEEMPGPAGVVFWQSMRDVTLWASVMEPEERAGLFFPGASEKRVEMLRRVKPDAGVEGPLGELAAISRDPVAMREGDVLASCRAVSDWADGKGLSATALAFATAGAVAAPTNAAAAVRVGILARRNGDHARAETWFRRAIGLGRQAKDWASYSEAFLGLGNLYYHRGNFPAARRFLIRALRASRRHSLRVIQAWVLHDLFRVSVETGRVEEAQEHARNAFRAYPADHPQLPALAHDLAYFWMTRGRFAPALTAFRAVLPHLENTANRHAAYAGIARAAGGAGDRPAFEEAWDQVWPVAHDASPTEAPCLLDLAYGAASLGEWGRAEMAANAARQIATRREQSKVLMAADAMLDSVRARKSVEARAERAGAGEEEADMLAADLARSLGTSSAAH
jgi:tetratricopeptide (TPR) repeat protein